MRPNIPNSINTARKIFNFHKNTFPFISGDLFADMADISMYSPKLRGRKPSMQQMSRARVIFCKSNKVEEFLLDYGKSVNAKVLILGNSDEDFETFDYQLPNSVKIVFAQNLMFQDPRFRCLPIGIENIRYGANGMPYLFSSKYAESRKKDKILIGPFGKTHMERYELDGLVYSDGPWECITTRLRPKEYARHAAEFKYIAAPRGNGMDTHRFWETVYRGGIPVVKRNLWSEGIKYLDIPFTEISAWEEGLLNALVKDDSTKMIHPGRIKDLWWPSWEQRIKSYL